MTGGGAARTIAAVREPPGEPSSSQLDDALVLAAVDRGDLEAAVRLLMKGHGDAIYRFCAGRLRSDAADDVHQQVFIEAHRDLPRFERRSSLRTWLFGIANHRCLDHIKTSGRHLNRFPPTETPGETDPSDDPSPFEHVSSEQLAGLLRHCLDQQDDKIKAAVLLRYRDGLQYEEIAQVLRQDTDTPGEKPGTLQQRVARALRALRKCLERRLKSTEVP